MVLHFPGFEPLTAAQHHDRYRRAAALSAKPWGLDLTVHPLERQNAGAVFGVDCATEAGTVTSRIHLFDHHAMVSLLSRRPVWRRLASGLASAATVTWRGGTHRYFLCAWRFGLFFLFPFVLIAAVAGVSVAAILLATRFGHLAGAIASLVAIIALFQVWRPLLRRVHVPLLLANWKFALMMAGPLDRVSQDWLQGLVWTARAAFDGEADEYVITAHSMGANIAVQVIGSLLEEEPALFDGKRVVFVTMGGAVLQCALVGGATQMRARVGTIARQENLQWIDVQCLVDPVSFYRSDVVRAAGHPGARPARIVFMRIRKMVSPERYRKMRGNFLRVHRQYVLGSDTRHGFDFTYLTAGPETAAAAGQWTARTASPAAGE